MALFQQIGINKFSVLGWSDGGISALILAQKHPNSLQKLVIWGANSYVTPEEIQIYESKNTILKGFRVCFNTTDNHSLICTKLVN